MVLERTPTLLLVEDEALIALNEKLFLERNRFTVVTASNGDEAVRTAGERQDVGLILMDIDLGAGMDGTEAARHILEERTVPIVFLTSHGEREMVAKVRDITRYGYVLKNTGEFVLLEAIHMALELFDAHRLLERSEHRYRTMVETAPMPFQSLDAEGRIIDVNRAWLETLGYTRDEVIGTWFGDLLDESQVDLFRERFPRFKHDGHIERVEFIMRRGDGSYITTLFNGCIAYREDGEFAHTVCIFQDITERKQSEAEMIRREAFLTAALAEARRS